MNKILPVIAPLLNPGNGNPGIVPPWIVPTFPPVPKAETTLKAAQPSFPTPIWQNPELPHIF
jgi:hypothetical protein